MKLILYYYRGDEYEGSYETIPFEHESLEDAEYEFLLKLEEAREGLAEITKWTEDNYPRTFHKTTRDEAFNNYMERYRSFYNSDKHSGRFIFCGETFYSFDINDTVKFLSLEDWFEQNKLKEHG